MKKYDLIVVGSSFASTFFLKKYLTKAPATSRVLVLERGEILPHKERLAMRRNGKADESRGILSSEETIIRKGNEGKPWIYQVSFGGNSNCWTAGTLRFMPSDFKLKSLYGVGYDWPISYEDLEPYYQEAEEIMSVSGPEQTPFPRTGKYPQPPHVLTSVDKILNKHYGNLYVNQPTARSRVAGNGRNACCVSNVCELCPVNAKFTIENSQIGVYEDSRVELVTGAQVLQLDMQGGQARGVVYIKDNKEVRAEAGIFALGANPIFNSHILLHSGDDNKNTGRGIGEQAGVYAIVKLNGLENVGGSTHVSANGYMLYEGDHRRNAAACLIEANNGAYVRLERGRYRQIVYFRMIFEDLPDDQNNYVSLSDDRQKPVVHFKDISDYAKKGIERMKEKFPGVLSVLPVEEIKYQDLYTESHIIGATRMSESPADGVVDRHLVHHKYRNVFVLGAGSFPAYSAANPTLTLSALSLFAADKSF